MHVHAEGRDESQSEVVAKRPGVGVGAKVPAHQRAVHSGVRQHRLGSRVKMVDVHRAAFFLEVQRPERRQQDRGRMRPDNQEMMNSSRFVGRSPGLERLHFGRFGRFVSFDR